MRKLKKVFTFVTSLMLVAAFGLSACNGCSNQSTGHEHEYDGASWKNDDTNHWNECTASGCPDNNKVNKAAHDTDGEDGKCSVCGYAKNIVTPPDSSGHSHLYSPTEWKNDETYHWNECIASGCSDNKLNKTVHDTMGVNGKCSVCGYGGAPEMVIPAGIKSAGGFEESLFVTYEGNATESVEYKLSSETSWTTVDAPLIRNVGSEVRVDVLGLKAGLYDVKIDDKTVENIAVKSYDRSGYAHFKYTDGVGAYKDDGTIKDNVLVIYVTEANKNDVLNSCYVGGSKVDITQYVTDAAGTVHKGIGEILNNRRYSGNDRKNVGIWRLTQVYGGVAVRVIGEVSNSFIDNLTCEIVGLTDYNSEGNGGTKGDSGGMARMINAKNVTIEGVGNDAVVKGWGFHFVASYRDGKQNDTTVGKSFEARNLTFVNYPEDALGMEGEQGTGLSSDGSLSGSKSTSSPIISPVERCWVHNNVFEQGGGLIAGAESDKNEGDGSCDFKRGRYYTFSYNYMEDCHKTNLLGSSDSSLQFDVSFHHNWYKNVKARQPLTRNSNVHYYNNYVSGAVDYVVSLRADCYVFFEANYFYGSKRLTDKDGGVAKGYANVYNGCYGGHSIQEVTDRTQKVENTCKYQAENIDYSAFDTDPNLFYYDAVNKKSDCYITDGVTARKVVMTTAGVHGFGRGEDELAINENTPEGSLSIPEEGLTIDLKNISSYTGIMGEQKAKGQAITFCLAQKAKISVTCSGGVLAAADGTVYADQFMQYDGVLPAGIYVISAQVLAFSGDKLGGNNLKEVSVTALSFSPTESDEELAQAVIDLINAIPATVKESDGAAIKAARAAYIGLDAAARVYVTNYDKLVSAETAYENIAITSINGQITALAAVDLTANEAGLRSQLANYNTVKELYDSISDAKKDSVVGYGKVSGGIASLTSALRPYDVRLMISNLPAAANVVIGDKDAIRAARAAYDSLNATEKNIVGDIAKLTAAEAAYKVLPKTVVAIFGYDSEKDGNLIALPDGVVAAGGYRSGVSFEYDGVTYYNPLKLETSTLVTFTLTEAATVTLYFKGSNSHVLVDGCNKKDEGHATDSSGKLVLHFEAGIHTITKGSGSNPLCYMIIEPD